LLDRSRQQRSAHLQFLTLQESPQYRFVPRFPILHQQMQFLQNRRFWVLLRAISSLDAFWPSIPLCARGDNGILRSGADKPFSNHIGHYFHRLRIMLAARTLCSLQSVGYNFRGAFLW
jgi:hypothetical protein